VGDSDMYVIG